MLPVQYDTLEEFIIAIDQHRPVVATIEMDHALAAIWANTYFADSEGRIHALEYQSEEEPIAAIHSLGDCTPLHIDRDQAVDSICEALERYNGSVDKSGSFQDEHHGFFQKVSADNPYELVLKAVDYFKPESASFGVNDDGKGMFHCKKGNYHLFVEIAEFDESKIPTVLSALKRVDYDIIEGILP